jgi:choline dehydrogenase-like flavoprotein
MLDVGYSKPAPVNPEDNFLELKGKLEDPVRYFLGSRYEAVIYPGAAGEYYGLPPQKGYVLTKPESFSVQACEFTPLFSFARGGVAEAWTGGVYPFNDVELKEFPFRYSDLEPYYTEVASRIGICGLKDDLARFLPLHANMGPALRLDQHSQYLLDRYEEQRQLLNQELRCYLGRSRIAVLSHDMEGRKSCTYLGRCLWGCPREALYTPSITLNQCCGYSNFRYVPGMYVNWFKYNASRHIASVVAESLADGRNHEFSAEAFVLAAGALSSSRIFMESIFRGDGEVIRLDGLMDNRQILIPYVHLRMIGQSYDPESYQYHQVAMGFETDLPEEYVHCQITTLKTALLHPIIQRIPLDLQSAISVFRGIRAAMGVVNVNLHDWRREENHVTLEVDSASARPRLRIQYSPPANEEQRISDTIRKVKRALWRLGCVVPPGLVHVRPMGASVHYAGTLPMSKEEANFTVTHDCRSHDFDNLHIVDGSTFPFLPAKNITFTLMANAVRVADLAF